MEEQILKDFIASAQKYNYDYDVVMPKFPELEGYDLQVLKDYIATAEQNNYDYEVVNPKFPELFEQDVKKKDTESISEDGSLGPLSLDRPFQERLKTVDAKTVGLTEEPAVQQLNADFNDFGFEFSEATLAIPGADVVSVLAPNGERARFSFDPRPVSMAQFSEMGSPPSMRQFESDLGKIRGQQSEEEKIQTAAEIRAWMSENMVADDKVINDIAKTLEPFTPVYRSDEASQQDINDFESSLKDFNGQKHLLVSQKDKIDAMSLLENMTEEEAEGFKSLKIDYNNNVVAFNKRANQIDNERLALKKRLKSYIDQKSDQGNFFGATYNSFISGISEDLVGGALKVIADVGFGLAKIGSDEERVASLTEIQRSVKSSLEETGKKVSAVAQNPNVSDEYIQRLQEESLVAEGVFGAARSIPAFALPGGNVVRIGGLMVQNMEAADREMQGEDWDDVSEEEKYLYKGPLAITTAVLENLGFSNVINASGLTSRLAFKALSKRGVKKTFAEIVEQDVKSGLARGSFRLVSGALAEAETGGLQAIAEVNAKRIWNAAKGSKDFETPELFSQEYYRLVARSAAAEAIGGLVIGAPTAAKSSLEGGFSNDLMQTLNSYREPLVKNMAIAKLQVDLSKGEITQSDYDARVADINNAAEIISLIPADANLSTQKQLYSLLSQETALKEKISNSRDPRFVKRETEQLKEINLRIEEVIENYQPAEQQPLAVEQGVDPEVVPEAGTTAEPTVEAVTNPEEELERQGVYIRGKGLKNKLEGVRRRFLSAKRFLPKLLFQDKEQGQANRAKQSSIVEQSISSFNKILEKTEDKKTFLRDFDNALRGGEGLNNLSGQAQELAVSMRNQIDALTISLVNEGLVTTGPSQAERNKIQSLDEKIEETKENLKNETLPKNIRTRLQKELESYESEKLEILNREYGADKLLGNLGQYLTRSYKVFDRDNWKDQVTSEAIETAKNFIRPSLKKRAAEEFETSQNIKGLSEEAYLESLVDAEIDKYINPKEAAEYAKSSESGSGVDAKILKEKQDIPKEIRALMGEYDNPIQNYAKSVMRMSATLETQRYLNKALKLGRGTWLFEKRSGTFSTEIKGTGSDLDGMFTTPEIAKEFSETEKNSNKLIEGYFKLVVGTKYAKTILSFGTHGKNLFGNLGFMYANGHLFNPFEAGSEMGKSFQVVFNDLKKGDNDYLNDKLNRYIELGIVKQSASIGELRDMFKDANFAEAVEARLNNQKTGLKNWTLRKFKGGLKFAEDVYQAEDDFFKIVAFEIENSRYSKALFGKPKDQLNEQQRAELDKYVSEIVKNTYPTYSRVPDAIKMLRKNPFIGNFVSFQAESYRVAFNTLSMGIQEAFSSNPEIKKIGAKRLAGAFSYQGVKSTAIAYLGKGAAAGLQGAIGALFDDDDENQMLSDIRMFSPEWTQNSSIIIIKNAFGKFEFIDISASDPYGNFDRIINELSEGKSPEEALANGLFQIVEPFTGVDISTRRLGNLLYNKKDTGGRIYNRADTFPEKASDIMSYFYQGTLEPGSMKSIRKVAGSDSKVVELAGQLTGLKPYKIDVEEQLGYRLRDLNTLRQDARSIRYEDNDRAEEQLEKVHEEIRKLMHAAERLGVHKKTILKLSANSGIGKERSRDIYIGRKEYLD